MGLFSNNLGVLGYTPPGLAANVAMNSAMNSGVFSKLGGLLGGGNNVEQVPLETPEQHAARLMLLNFAQTGKFGNFTAGEQIPIQYGDYRMTPEEQTGLSNLQQLIRTPLSDRYNMSDAALQDALQTDSAAIEAQFSPFKAQVQRSISESNRDLLRNAGVMGNLYSTDTVRKLGDVQARGNETLASKMAELTDAFMNRRLQAAGLAQQSAQQQEAENINRVAASQQLGSLARNLNNQAVQDRNSELLRRRQEMQLPIQAAEAVSGSNVQWGIPSVSTSPYQDLLSLVGQIGGQYLGNELFLRQRNRLNGHQDKDQ